jgi:hypothetical protein
MAADNLNLARPSVRPQKNYHSLNMHKAKALAGSRLGVRWRTFVHGLW